MTFTFSLLDEPWVPCSDLNGDLRVLGLRETLVNSHKLRSIECTDPLEIAAIIRLLLTVLHRVFPSETVNQWTKQWQAGAWDSTRLNDYFQKWSDRFDLFHPQYPFYQQRDDRLPPRTIARIFPGLDASTWFNHEVDGDSLSLTPAEAARALLAAQTFGLPGIRHPQLNLYFSGGPWLTGMVFFVSGATLYETLNLNWLQYARDHPRPTLEKTFEDRPVWESDDPFTPEREIPLGYLDYLTYPNRKIFFLPIETPEGVRIREMIDSPGLKLRVELQDPFKHYQQTKNGLTFLFLNPDKALWRNSHTLLAIEGEGKRPIQALSWLGNLAANGVMDEHVRYRLVAVGVVSKQAKASLARMEQMTLPVNLLNQPDKVGVIGEMLDHSESLRKTIWGALYRLGEQFVALQANLPDGRSPDPKDIKALIEHWKVIPWYWQSLEQPFLRLIGELANGIDAQVVRSSWQKNLQKSAWATLEAAITQTGESPQALKAAVLARNQLAAGWVKIFPDGSTKKGA
ncbi:MAG: type I-E CRISPR-associated protein Cse1/CasA [Bellilinea sp.]